MRHRAPWLLCGAPAGAHRAGGAAWCAPGAGHCECLSGEGGAEDVVPAETVLALVLEHGGTISAEHGVGIAKAGWLERARGADEVAAMRAVKAALDPDGRMNPGAVLLSP